MDWSITVVHCLNYACIHNLRNIQGLYICNLKEITLDQIGLCKNKERDKNNKEEKHIHTKECIIEGNGSFYCSETEHEIKKNDLIKVDHVCGLSGFGALGDSCLRCDLTNKGFKG